MNRGPGAARTRHLGGVFISAEAEPDHGTGRTYRARTYFRDFNGRTREVTARGKTRRAAETRLMAKLRELSSARYGGTLEASDDFSAAAAVWIERIHAMVTEG